jgi:hypothetical protein
LALLSQKYKRRLPANRISGAPQTGAALPKRWITLRSFARLKKHRRPWKNRERKPRNT